MHYSKLDEPRTVVKRSWLKIEEKMIERERDEDARQE